MKDSLVTTLNLRVARRHLADMSNNCTKERAARAARLFFPYSNNDITHLFHCCCLNSLLVGVLDTKCGLSLIIFSPL